MAGRARFGEVLELFDRKLCQRVKLQRGVECKHTVHQRRLSGRNAVFPRLLRKSRVLRKRLRQDGRPRFACLQTPSTVLVSSRWSFSARAVSLSSTEIMMAEEMLSR